MKLTDDRYLVDGLRLTGCKNEEGTGIERLHHLLFSLEDELKHPSAVWFGNTNWEANGVVDGAPMTGQSPASAPSLAESLRDFRARAAEWVLPASAPLVSGSFDLTARVRLDKAFSSAKGRRP